MSRLSQNCLCHSSRLRHEPQTVIKFIKSIRGLRSSIVFHVPASRVSFRSDIHVEHTQLPTIGIVENESSLRRSLSLRALPCTFPRMDACIRNAEETSRRRRTLQGDLTWVPWVLINRRGFDIACHEIPFVWLSRERMRIVIMRARVRVENTRVYHTRSLILRIAAACRRRLESRIIELSDNLEKYHSFNPWKYIEIITHSFFGLFQF